MENTNNKTAVLFDDCQKSVCCTMCGKQFDEWDTQENNCFKKKIGYGSIHDGETISINLCCDCFDKVINILETMCIEPIVII